MRRLLLVLSLAVGVVAGAFLNRYPAWGTTRHAYCTLCAAHREDIERTPVLGRHRASSVRSGILARLLSPAVGEHTHVWSNAAYVAPTNPPPKLTTNEAFAQVIAEAEVRDLEQLEESPHAIALLDEAMRQDRTRAVAFIQRVLDPRAHVPVEAIGLLDRAAPWDERWAIVDAFLRAYRCGESEVAVSCRMRAGSTDLLMLVRTTTSVHSGGVDWTRWTPSSAAGAPETFAVTTAYARP